MHMHTKRMNSFGNWLIKTKKHHFIATTTSSDANKASRLKDEDNAFKDKKMTENETCNS